MDKDSLIGQALGELRHFRLLPYSKRPPEHAFSRRFMSRLHRQYRRYLWDCRRKSIWQNRGSILVCFLATLFSVGLCVASYHLWGEAFLRRGTISGQEDLLVPTDFSLYAMTKPPEGYHLLSMTVTKTGLEQVWQDEKLRRIGFSQFLLTEEAPVADGEMQPVWGVEGIAYGDNGGNALQWLVGQCLYRLWAEGTSPTGADLVSALGPWSVEDLASLNGLPRDYAAVDARDDGCMVLTLFSVENEQALADFLSDLDQGKETFLRICDYRLGDGPPAVFDLRGNEDGFVLVEDYSRLAQWEVQYVQSAYQRASLLEAAGQKTLLLYAQGETEPKQLLQYEGQQSGRNTIP